MRIPEFSVYDGGDQFVFQKIVLRRGKCLGEGSFAQVFLFEAEDKKNKYAVKCEKAENYCYAHGRYFENEATWYQVIYGLGVLSGDPACQYAPHYILMPYFSGILLEVKHFASEKELFFYWIWTAIAVRHLHQQHQIIHGDLKANNVIAARDQVFLIDFGFTAKIHDIRLFHFYPEDRFFIRHQASELFFDQPKEKRAHESQDIYSLGLMLRNLFSLFHMEKTSENAAFLETQNKVILITQNMTLYQPMLRWSIEKSIYMLSVACLSSIPKTIWSRVCLENTTTSHTVFNTAIQVRIDELMLEQENKKSPSPVKEKKIDGLKKLQQKIAEKPSRALEAVLEARKDAALTAGILLHRTEDLLSDLSEIGRTLRLLH